MATDNKKEEGKTEDTQAAQNKALKASRTDSKEELATKEYELRRDVTIGDKFYKKGTSYPLTEKGRKYFKSLNYIK